MSPRDTQETQASNRLANANISSHGPRVRQRQEQRKTNEHQKGTKISNTVSKAHTRAKHRKLVSKVLKTRKSEAISDTHPSRHVDTTDTSWNDGWNCDEWNDGWSFDEWNERVEFYWMARRLGTTVWHFHKLICTWRFWMSVSPTSPKHI